MDYTIEVYKNYDGAETNRIIRRTADQASIPFDPANTDYRHYLEWLATSQPDYVVIQEPAPERPPQPVLTSPDGTSFRLEVTDEGVLVPAPMIEEGLI